jgi:hypothetical protein
VTEAIELLSDAYYLVTADLPGLAVIALICGIAAYGIRTYLALAPMSVFIFVAMVLLAMAIEYVLIQIGVFAPRPAEQWLLRTMFAAAGGSIGTIGALGAAAALRYGRSGRIKGKTR